MDQQQKDQQKKKRPYYHHKRKPAANQNTVDEAPKNASPAPNHGGNPRTSNRPHTDIQTKRGAFHPAPDAAEESRKPAGDSTREPREAKEPKTQKERRDNRDRDNRGNHKNRGGKGRGGEGRPAAESNAPKEQRAPEDRVQSHASDGKPADNRNRRGDKGRGRKSENRISSEETFARRENTPSQRDADRDAWLTPPIAESRTELAFPIAKTPDPVSTEPLPHIELDLTDILPPIALENHPELRAEVPAETAETAEETAEEPTPVIEVVGVRFSKTGKVYYFAPNGNIANRGDHVIVETARGPEFGEVWQPNHVVQEHEIVPPLRPVIRMADEKDAAHNADNRRREEDAFRICLDKIKAHGLDMKLVEAQYTFDNSKLLFYFTSAGRVDFRELVKDLASVFRTRIELRQIGIRDEAKLMGGLGICGRPLCCASFLSDFTQVSIKMAKEQNLSLNSAKISGTCGRLMCCLNYEYAVYCEEARRTPSVGSIVSTPDGNGTVVETHPLSGTVKVLPANAPAGTLPQQYRREDVRVLNESRRHDDESENKDPREDA